MDHSKKKHRQLAFYDGKLLPKYRKKIKEREKPNKCVHCGKRFFYISSLHTHKTIHTGQKPHKCPLCNKKFTQFCNLQMHKRVHTKEKPYDCTFCSKKFSQISNLESHQRIHTGEKPFQCNLCDKKFTQFSQLKLHRRVHTDEQPYECTFCEKRFSQISNLESHQRIHTGERPYQCTLCDKKFKQLSHLKMHGRIHTEERPYNCESCFKTFKQLSHLQRHQLTHSKTLKSECSASGGTLAQLSDLPRRQSIHFEGMQQSSTSGETFIPISDLPSLSEETPREGDETFAQPSSLRNIRIHSEGTEYECSVSNETIVPLSEHTEASTKVPGSQCQESIKLEGMQSECIVHNEPSSQIRVLEINKNMRSEKLPHERIEKSSKLSALQYQEKIGSEEMLGDLNVYNETSALPSGFQSGKRIHSEIMQCEHTETSAKICGSLYQERTRSKGMSSENIVYNDPSSPIPNPQSVVRIRSEGFPHERTETYAKLSSLQSQEKIRSEGMQPGLNVCNETSALPSGFQSGKRINSEIMPCERSEKSAKVSGSQSQESICLEQLPSESSETPANISGLQTNEIIHSEIMSYEQTVASTKVSGSQFRERIRLELMPSANIVSIGPFSPIPDLQSDERIRSKNPLQLREIKDEFFGLKSQARIHSGGMSCQSTETSAKHIDLQSLKRVLSEAPPLAHTETSVTFSGLQRLPQKRPETSAPLSDLHSQKSTRSKKKSCKRQFGTQTSADVFGLHNPQRIRSRRTSDDFSASNRTVSNHSQIKLFTTMTAIMMMMQQTLAQL